MKEKLLALLVAAFAGVDKAILEKIAENKAAGVTDEAQLQTIADGVTISDVIQSEADRRATDATKNAVLNYEKKHGLKEGKLINPKTPPKKPDEGGNEEITELKESVTKLTELVTTMATGQKNSQTLETVKAQLKEKGVPDKFIDTYAAQVNLEAEDLVAEVTKAYDGYDTLQKSIKADMIESGDYKPSGGSPNEESTAESIKGWSPE